MNSELKAPWDFVSGFPPLAHITEHAQDLIFLKRHSIISNLSPSIILRNFQIVKITTAISCCALGCFENAKPSLLGETKT